MKTLAPLLTFALAVAVTTPAGFGAEPVKSPVVVTNHPLEFIDTSFENASPLWYDFALRPGSFWSVTAFTFSEA